VLRRGDDVGLDEEFEVLHRMLIVSDGFQELERLTFLMSRRDRLIMAFLKLSAMVSVVRELASLGMRKYRV
jgi:hypothetical protein